MIIRKTRSGRFEARKMAFLTTPSDNLYSRNLDNDTGVFHNLLDSAEEEETKEAVLAWYFLRAAGQPSTLSALDEHIEGWFRERLAARPTSRSTTVSRSSYGSAWSRPMTVG